MNRLLKVTLVTLLLSGSAFAYVLWNQWSSFGGNAQVVDTRTEAQKARVGAPRNLEAIAAYRKKREQKAAQRITDREKLEIAKLLDVPNTNDLPFTNFKLLINRRADGREHIYGSDLRRAAELQTDRRDSLDWLRKRSSGHAQPTLSKHANSTLRQPPPQHPANTDQLISLLSNYRKLGIEHFRHESLPNLGRDKQREVADFMATVVDLGFEVDVLNRWQTKRDECQVWLTQFPSLSDDPLFNYCAGTIYARCGDYHLANTTLTKAITGFTQRYYPTRDVIAAYDRLTRTWNHVDTPSNAVTILVDYGLATCHWLQFDYRATTDELRAVQHQLEPLMQQLAKVDGAAATCLSVIGKQEHLPRALKSTLHGLYFTKLNQRYEKLPSLTTKGIALISKQWKLAQDFYADALAADPLNEVALFEIERTSRVTEKHDEASRRFNQLIAARPDYFAGYRSRMYGLGAGPKGSFKKMIAFAKRHAEANRGKNSIPYVLPQCYFQLRNVFKRDPEERAKLLRDPDFVHAVIQAIDGLLEQDNQLTIDANRYQPNFLLTMKARLAASIDDMPTANQAFRDLNDNPSREATTHFGVESTFDVMRCASYARTSEYEVEAKRLSELLGDSPQTRLQNADKILELTDATLLDMSDNVGGLYFKRAQAQVRLEQQFHAGEAVALKFDPSLLLWESFDVSKLTYIGQDSLLLDNRDGHYRCALNSIVHLPGSKIVEFELEHAPHEPQHAGDIFSPALVVSGGGDESIAIGVAPDVRKSSNEPLEIDGRSIAKSFLLMGGLNQRNQEHFRIDLPSRKVRFRIQMSRDYLEVYLNGKFCYRTRLWGQTDPNPVFKLRQHGVLKGRNTATVSNIRVTRWANAPPLDDDPKLLIAYYLGEVKRQPKDPWNRCWLGMAHHENGDYEEALKHYRQSIDLGVSAGWLGYYVGDAHEQLGALESANEWYQKAINDPSKEIVRLPHMFRKSGQSRPQNWAAFRLRWQQAFSPTPVDEPVPVISPSIIAIPPGVPFASPLLYAQINAQNNNLQKGAEIITRHYSDLPENLQPLGRAMLTAFQQGQAYTPVPADQRRYNDFHPRIKPFHHLD